METKTKKTRASNGEAISTKGHERVATLLSKLEDIEDKLGDVFNIYFDEIINETVMSDAERRRLLGSGVRRYGFIDKVADVASVNSEFAPPFLNINDLKDKLRVIEELRNVGTRLQQLLRFNNDLLLSVGDDAFRQALSYYNTVREAARSRTPGAVQVFQTLQLFFRRMRGKSLEPTEPEIERDVRALLHGKKDGKIIIENEKPHLVGGKHVVVDEIHRDKIGFRESESGEVVE
jgi:hypothetical protein